MKKSCKRCRHFREMEGRFYCTVLKTHCAPVNDPDMGTKLGRCVFEKKEVSDDGLPAQLEGNE